MEAKTDTRARSPSRLAIEGPDGPVLRFRGGAVRRARDVAVAGNSADAAMHPAEVFKRTPSIADLKPGGRYVAKDMFEVGGIPLLMKTPPDDGCRQGDRVTVTGRTIVENLTAVIRDQDGKGEKQSHADA